MGRIVLVCRLAARDLRRRPAQAVLVLLVIAAATATLTLGLALHGVTSQPYQRTRAATAGPDVVVSAFLQNGGSPASLIALARAPSVTGHSGPYPLASPVLRAHGHTVAVEAEGRDPAPASIDQPKLTQGSWVRPGEVVERSFADVLGIRAGDRVTLNGRPSGSLGSRSPPPPVLPDGESRPDLAHPGGCPELCPLPAVSCHVRAATGLHAEPEAGRPGRGPGVRQRAQHARTSHAGLAGHP
jgi:putative ABC transport system permease protein